MENGPVEIVVIFPLKMVDLSMAKCGCSPEGNQGAPPCMYILSYNILLFILSVPTHQQEFLSTAMSNHSSHPWRLYPCLCWSYPHYSSLFRYSSALLRTSPVWRDGNVIHHLISTFINPIPLDEMNATQSIALSDQHDMGATSWAFTGICGVYPRTRRWRSI